MEERLEQQRQRVNGDDDDEREPDGLPPRPRCAQRKQIALQRSARDPEDDRQHDRVLDETRNRCAVAIEQVVGRISTCGTAGVRKDGVGADKREPGREPRRHSAPRSDGRMRMKCAGELLERDAEQWARYQQVVVDDHHAPVAHDPGVASSAGSSAKSQASHPFRRLSRRRQGRARRAGRH